MAKVTNKKNVSILLTPTEASFLADALCYVGGRSERASALYDLAEKLSEAGVENTVLPDEIGVCTADPDIAGVLFD